jgi:hypothetical protein
MIIYPEGYRGLVARNIKHQASSMEYGIWNMPGEVET